MNLFKSVLPTLNDIQCQCPLSMSMVMSLNCLKNGVNGAHKDYSKTMVFKNEDRVSDRVTLPLIDWSPHSFYMIHSTQPPSAPKELEKGTWQEQREVFQDVPDNPGPMCTCAYFRMYIVKYIYHMTVRVP